MILCRVSRNATRLRGNVIGRYVLGSSLVRRQGVQFSHRFSRGIRLKSSLPVPKKPPRNNKNDEDNSLWKPLLKATVGILTIVVGSRVFFVVLRGTAAASTAALSPVVLGCSAIALGGLILARKSGYGMERLLPLAFFGVVGVGVATILVRDSEAASVQSVVRDAEQRLRALEKDGAVLHVMRRSDPVRKTTQEGLVGFSMLGPQEMDIIIHVRRSKRNSAVMNESFRLTARREHLAGEWKLVSIYDEATNALVFEGTLLGVS